MTPSAGMRPTPRSKTPRGVLQVDWPFFGELCRVAGAQGLSRIRPRSRHRDRESRRHSRRGRREHPATRLRVDRDHEGGSVIAGPPRLVTGKRVLLVDETCESGQYDEARARCRARLETRGREDGGVVQDRHLQARLPRARERETSSSCRGTSKSSLTARSWSAPITAPKLKEPR